MMVSKGNEVSNLPKSFISDMDGVVYKGSQLVPGADTFVEKLKRGGHKFLFLTNNSKQTPLDLRRKMLDLGIELEEKHFYTSALATAAFLNMQNPKGSAFVIGDAGLTKALYDVGYSITERNPDYVVVGETFNYNFEQIQKALFFIERGARFIATNPDLTGPTEHGNIPACGALTAPIERASRRSPYYIGKPNALMMRIALRMLGDHSENTVMIGDRMDTDIVAGLETGLTTCLVLTGVSSPETLKYFPYRPDFIFDSIKEIEPNDLGANAKEKTA